MPKLCIICGCECEVNEIVCSDDCQFDLDVSEIGYAEAKVLEGRRKGFSYYNGVKYYDGE